MYDFTGKQLCWNLLLIKFIKKETQLQVFSCEFCETFKDTFFYRTSLLGVSASKSTQSLFYPRDKNLLIDSDSINTKPLYQVITCVKH